MKRLTLPAALLWLAGALAAQLGKPILGTVTEFKANAFEIGVKADSGETVFVAFGTDTEVVQVPPGERDLGKGTPAVVTGILPGDRVMASFVPGMAEARRIVLISSRDIAARNAAEKLDWQQRGISGIAVSQNGHEIIVEIRTPQGAHTAIVTVTEKTRFRRYAPDSVKFSEAIGGTIGEIAAGDQVRARGLKSEDGSKVAAADVVFGTFLTRLGTITAVNPGAHEIQIQDVITKGPLTIHLTADSRLKMMPDMHAIMFGRKPPAEAPAEKPFDMQTMLERLPAARMEDLKPGGSVVVTSTKGATSDSVTAILLLANADFVVQMAKGQNSGEGGLDGLRQLHGGMLVGASGFSLPTMIQ